MVLVCPDMAWLDDSYLPEGVDGTCLPGLRKAGMPWVDGNYLPRVVDGTCLPGIGLMGATCVEGLMVLVCPDFLSLEFLSWLASGIPC